MSNLALAIAITAEGFKNKVDRGGKPYILHCLAVMYRLNTTDEELMIIGLMHDNVEDKIHTIQQLREKGFSERILTALELLSFDKKLPYMFNIKNLLDNKDARQAKIADLHENMDLRRLEEIEEEDVIRFKKYATALNLLMNC